MNVTGHMILDSLDFLKERVKSLESQFTGSLFRFEDEEDKRDPREILLDFEALQNRIARLMEVQAAYNLRVRVAVLGEEMTLQRVLHQVASANRVKTLWTQAAEQKLPNQYHFANPLARDKENEYAKPVVPVSEAREQADLASKAALAFKQAIRSGNAREVEMDVSPEVSSFRPDNRTTVLAGDRSRLTGQGWRSENSVCLAHSPTGLAGTCSVIEPQQS